MNEPYLHGYGPGERQRLQDQALTLADLLHHDTAYPAGTRVLEAGCGVGAQTLELGRRSPDAWITSIDVAAESVAEASRLVATAGLTNVDVLRADLYRTPFAPESFDYVFVCFVLEHLANPRAALAALKRLLKPGGSIEVIEGDHGSAYFQPDSLHARAAIECQIELQRRSAGNALIGRQVRPLLVEAGFQGVSVQPRVIYADSRRPDLVEGFIKKTFTAMIEGVRGPALAARLITPENFDAGVRDLHRTAETDGMFCYTFFKGVGRKPPADEEHRKP